MPILYVTFDEQHNCLKRNPYLDLEKRFNDFKEKLNGKEIELRLGDGKNNGGFCDGFYTDGNYCCNPRIIFKFADVNNKEEKNKDTFVRMMYAFDYEECDELKYFLQKIQALKLRIPYIYIPNVTYFDFNFQIDVDKLNWNFDVIVPENKDILNVCHSLMSMLITLFAFDE